MGDAGRPYWSQEVASQIDIFIQHSEDPNNVVFEADFTLFLQTGSNIYILYSGLRLVIGFE